MATSFIAAHLCTLLETQSVHISTLQSEEQVQAARRLVSLGIARIRGQWLTVARGETPARTSPRKHPYQARV